MIINIDGLEGNASALISVAIRMCRLNGINRLEVVQEMKNGDYKHLLTTFRKYFPEITLISNDSDLKEVLR